MSEDWSDETPPPIDLSDPRQALPLVVERLYQQRREMRHVRADVQKHDARLDSLEATRVDLVGVDGGGGKLSTIWRDLRGLGDKARGIADRVTKLETTLGRVTAVAFAGSVVGGGVVAGIGFVLDLAGLLK